MNLGNETTFDAIVVGTGISGGWAAKSSQKKVKNLGFRKRPYGSSY